MANVDPKEHQEAVPRTGDDHSLAEHADSDESSGIGQPEDILDKLPQDRQREFIRTIASMTATMSVGNSLADRFTGEHISDIISIRREETHLEYQDRKAFRLILTCFAVFVILVAVGFSVFLANKQMDALLVDLFTKVIIALGGFGAGWGASRFRR